MTNRENYWRDTETQLFAHNRMQEEAQRVDPMKEEWGTGWIGRIRDNLENKQGKSVGAFSVAGAQIALIGPRGEVETPMVISGSGITKFDPSPTYANMSEAIDMINGKTTSDSGAMAEWYSGECCIVFVTMSYSCIVVHTISALLISCVPYHLLCRDTYQISRK